MLLSHASQDCYDDCLSVFKNHPVLLLYPACATAVCLLISAGILFATDSVELLRSIRIRDEIDIPKASGVVVAGLYFANIFVAAFFNAALTAAALNLLRGKDVTFMGGIRVAVKRLPTITQWVLVSGTVGWLMRGSYRLGSLLDDSETGVAPMSGLGLRLGFVGNIAWAFATMFVIHAIVVEDVGVIEAVKHSAGVFKKRWGRATTSFVGFGILMIVIGIPGTILVGIAPYLGGVAGSVVLFVGVAWLVVTGLSTPLFARFGTPPCTSS